MTMNEFSQSTKKLLSDCSTTQKEHLLVELARELISNTGRPVPIQDSTGTVLGYLVPVTTPEAFPPDEHSVEFCYELRRRHEQEPNLTTEEFLSLLKSPV